MGVRKPRRKAMDKIAKIQGKIVKGRSINFGLSEGPTKGPGTAKVKSIVKDGTAGGRTRARAARFSPDQRAATGVLDGGADGRGTGASGPPDADPTDSPTR